MVTLNKNIQPLKSLFTRARSEILKLLYLNPEEEYYLREIDQKTGLGLGPTQRELKQLVDFGLVKRRESGNRTYFSAQANAIFDELRAIVLKTLGGAAEIESALWPFKNRIHKAFIYGSYAKGGFKSTSDIDLMIVGDLTSYKVIEILLPVMDKLSREINSTVMTKKEFELKLKDGHYFITEVWHNGKILPLIGDGNDN